MPQTARRGHISRTIPRHTKTVQTADHNLQYHKTPSPALAMQYHNMGPHTNTPVGQQHHVSPPKRHPTYSQPQTNTHIQDLTPAMDTLKALLHQPRHTPHKTLPHPLPHTAEETIHPSWAQVIKPHLTRRIKDSLKELLYNNPRGTSTQLPQLRKGHLKLHFDVDLIKIYPPVCRGNLIHYKVEWQWEKNTDYDIARQINADSRYRTRRKPQRSTTTSTLPGSKI